MDFHHPEMTDRTARDDRAQPDHEIAEPVDDMLEALKPDDQFQ